MATWNTIGHEKTIQSLGRSLELDRVSHAYLVTGPRGVGKATLALDFTRALNCLGDDRPCGECTQCQRIAAGTHTDVRTVGVVADAGDDVRARVAIGIDQVRELQHEASLKPYEGRFRVFIIDEADRMSEEAANALLKTLEEPPDQVALLLLAVEPDRLLPTVTSRCRRLDLRPVRRDLIAAELEGRYRLDPADAEELARLSEGRPGWAFRAAAGPAVMEALSRTLDTVEAAIGGRLEQRFALAESMANAFRRSRDGVRSELEIWLGWWRDVLVVREGVPHLVTNRSRMDALSAAAGGLSAARVAGAIRAIQETWELLESNVNPRLVLEGLMLALPRLDLDASDGRDSTAPAEAAAS